jgi:hypothetical protein
LKGNCPLRIRVTKEVIIVLIVIMATATPVHGSGKLWKIGNHFGKELGRQLGQKVVSDSKKNQTQWKKNRRKIQKETCRLFKDLLIKKRIIKSDLELIEGFIDERLPREWKPKRHYISDLERIGYKLIDPALTIIDYEHLKDLFNRIWNTRPDNPWHTILWNELGEYGKQTYYLPPMFWRLAL